MTAGGDGQATLVATVPASGCDTVYLQAVNLDACSKSNTVQP